MRKKIYLYLVGVFILLNVYAWNEVFALAKGDNLKVDFLDVGQGDAIFIETPQHHQILIDGGPDSKILAKLQGLMPAKDMSLDIVILTHPERDHLMGLLDVLQRYKVGYIFWTGVIRDTPEYDQWVKLLEEEREDGAKIIVSRTGQKITAGNIIIDTLYPLENLSGKKLKDSNDSSIVSRLIFGNDSFLFTGDITGVVEKELVNEKSDLASDVLKAAHHGSKYSTSDEFLENVEPEIAVIEVGKSNIYGHPTPEVLQRLDKFGIKVLRTDIDGDIEIVSDGNNIYMRK